MRRKIAVDFRGEYTKEEEHEKEKRCDLELNFFDVIFFSS